MGAEELFNMTLFLPSASEGAGMYKLESSVNSAKDGLFCLLKLLESCLRVPPTRSKESMYVRMSALCSTHSNETRPLPQKGHIVESRRFWPVHALRKQESLESREYLVLLFCEVSNVCLPCSRVQIVSVIVLTSLARKKRRYRASYCAQTHDRPEDCRAQRQQQH